MTVTTDKDHFSIAFNGPFLLHFYRKKPLFFLSLLLFVCLLLSVLVLFLDRKTSKIDNEMSRKKKERNGSMISLKSALFCALINPHFTLHKPSVLQEAIYHNHF